MGGFDPREPLPVATQISMQLQRRWVRHPPSNPIIIITQGDPYEERGISAITRLVADQLGVKRGMIFLDSAIADYHKSNADHYKVMTEISYSTLANELHANDPRTLRTIEQSVQKKLRLKNAKRREMGKPILQNYYLDFALLQEVTKVACKQICGEITIAQTSRKISEFSVTSFYKVGLELGLIEEDDIISYEGGD